MYRFLPGFKSPVCVSAGVTSLLLAGSLLFPTHADAKDVPVTGILLLRGTNAPAYLQIVGLAINGKTELRVCGGSSTIDKSAYKNMPKLSMLGLKSMERLPDGTLSAQTSVGTPTCVVPGNFKFERDGAISTATLIAKSTYSGQIVGSSPAGQTIIPPFPVGAKLLFGSATDSELADFSLAEREKTTSLWQAYFDRNRQGAHSDEAKKDFVKVLVGEGNGQLNAYLASASSQSPRFDALKLAKDRLDQALGILHADPDAINLQIKVRSQLKLLSDQASTQLQTFKDALTGHKSQYQSLVTATQLSSHIIEVDPSYPDGLTVYQAVTSENHSLDAAIESATNLAASKDFDKSLSAVSKYVSLAGEEPRVGKIVTGAYDFHLQKGNDEINASSWKDAVDDLSRAAEIKPTEEAQASLRQAQAGLLASQNKAAADKALAQSQNAVLEKDYITAYEVLANLNEAPRLLVKDNMAALKDDYVHSATARAMELQKLHTPIQGKEDENDLRQAYDYLDRASKLSDDTDLGLKLDQVGLEIGVYYIDLGKKYLERPLSSGVGIGWAYLAEAARYIPKTSQQQLDIIKDLRTVNKPAYQLHARLSLGVVFLDQTSRRDSLQFAEQMQHAFQTGLGGPGMSVIGLNTNISDTLKPNFIFKGEILQHRPISTPKKETLRSSFHNGTREVQNEEWNKADSVFESINLRLTDVEGKLDAARRKNNKKEIDAAEKERNAIVGERQIALEKMNSVAKTKTEEITTPYNYIKRTLELKTIVELQFEVLDMDNQVFGDIVKITKGDTPKTFTMLEGLNANDAEDVKEGDTPPDETQLMNDAEIEARDAIVAAARERSNTLPQRILARARELKANGESEGAGESYVLYLNSTPAEETPERNEAIQFLSKTFNLRESYKLSAAAN